MSTKLRAGSSEAPINFFTLLLKIYFMGYIHQQWVIRSKLVGIGNQCSQNAKLNYFGSQVYFHFSPKICYKMQNASKFLQHHIFLLIFVANIYESIFCFYLKLNKETQLVFFIEKKFVNIFLQIVLIFSRLSDTVH